MLRLIREFTKSVCIPASVIDYLIKLLNGGVLPQIPSQGSVGASGDLAPLAHLSCGSIGVGNVSVNGQVMSASDGLKSLGLEPLQLDPKEGLALLNGTQVSTALALSGLFSAIDVFGASPAGPLSVLATLPWGNVWVLVHTETAVSRLHQSLSIFEVGFVIRCGRPGSCVRPRHSSSTVRFTVCVGWIYRGI